MRGCALALAVAILGLACATQQPVLYPNDHFESVGKEAAHEDVRRCIAFAESQDLDATSEPEIVRQSAAGAAVGGAAGSAAGAVRGRAGAGAAAGAAGGAAGGFVRGLFRSREPDPVFRRFVERCLWEEGYEVVGWH